MREEFPICDVASDDEGKTLLSCFAYVENFEGSPVCAVQDKDGTEKPPCMTGWEERSVTASWVIK